MENFTSTSIFSSGFNETTSSISYENLTTVPKPVLNKYYPYLAAELGFSILCSVILILVYVIIGEYKTLPGKNVICISLSLIVTYILLIVDLLMRNRIPFNTCFTIGVTIQATFLATFFWTNVMSYDIMRTMASVKPDTVRTSKFWKYSAYAWFMTLICVLPAIVIDLTDFVPEEYRPKFGVKKCWLSGQLAFLLYFNLPVGLTLASNCIFFVLTARTIVRVRSATAILAANRHKKRFRLCMKLVLIMGLVWITEFVPWLTGIYYLYAIAGMLNCLHGVYLFLIFVCKRRILKQVVTNLSCRCSRATPSTIKKKQSPSLDTITTTVSNICSP
ncbi:probable G-protein coupled receptor Mth-like 1 [Argiope bruennichi]|uniref:probable G-protein coupled receptor Mth-like 1 n=1 Tax=Argiope bruennichi TaxID=94029 RepID=UPI0024951956|nr:probable G-protein coupled receptor Mth-like 1 [Argiope bruennichi]